MTKFTILVLVCLCVQVIKMEESDVEVASTLAKLLNKVNKMDKSKMDASANNNNGDNKPDKSASSQIETLLDKINNEIGELQSSSANSNSNTDPANIEYNADSETANQGIALVLDALRASAERMAKLRQRLEIDLDKTQNFADDFVTELKDVALQLLQPRDNSTDESRSFHSRHCVHVFRPCGGSTFPLCCDTDTIEDSEPFEQCCIPTGKLLKIGPIQSNRAIHSSIHPPLGICLPNPYPFKDCPTGHNV
ncbi:hypothetical protein ACF0H5_022785 [Mactra antiquata]